MTKKEVLQICRDSRKDIKRVMKTGEHVMLEFYCDQTSLDFFSYLIDELTGKHKKKQKDDYYW